MTRVTVVEIEGCLASGAAITHDVMATANQISKTAKRALPFDVTTVRLGPRRKRERLRGADLVIVPGLGLGVASADELDAKLKSPACRRACDMLVQSFEAGAALAAACASTFLLAETGLLDGRRATTTWWLGAAVPRALSEGRTGERPDCRRRLADCDRRRGDGADGFDACNRRQVCRTEAGQRLRQLSAAGRTALPGAVHGDQLSGEPGPENRQERKNGCGQISRAILRSRNSPRPSRSRRAHLPGASRRPAASRPFSSFNASGLRPQDTCSRPRACRSIKLPGRSAMRSRPPFAA